MMQTLKLVTVLSAVLLWTTDAWAIDSYRYLHVTIDTPWLIFIFLFFLVFAPMILSAIIYVRNAMKKDQEDTDLDRRV